MKEVSAESSQSNEAFLLDPFSEEEPQMSNTMTISTGFDQPLTITTTPGSLDSDDKVF